MQKLLLFVFVIACTTLEACRPEDPHAVAWSSRFGPVVGNDMIVGRTYIDGRVLLMTDAPELVDVDLERHRATRAPVSGRGVDVLWGLARLDDGSLWTLAGQRALGRLSPDGEISERIPLAAAHVGLFSTGRELVYQVLDFHPPGGALVAGPPGEQARHPWSVIQTRTFGLARASVAALNLVSCGATDTPEIPCWFPDEAAVTLVARDGVSRRVVLPGLSVVAAEVLLTSENPARPVRDVFVAASRDLWVLGSGTAGKTQGAAVRGGWLLVRYDNSGRIARRADLPAAARLILRARADRCLLLAADGRVVEVQL